MPPKVSLPPPFADAYYVPWCYLWLQVQWHRDQLANWLGQHKNLNLDDSFARLSAKLPEVSDKLRATNSVDYNTLAEALACLRALEQAYPRDVRMAVPLGKTVQHGGQKYVLVPPVRQLARPQSSVAQGIRLSRTLGTAGALGLDFAWVPLQAEDDLDWRAIEALEGLRGAEQLRVGMAPTATPGDMDWHLNADDKRGLDVRVPVFCKGAKDAEALWAVMQKIFEAAWENSVQVLVFPELVVDAGLLRRCMDWLEKNNLRENRIQLVVAGSRHCREGDEFANRCTVLGHLGDILWMQDKRSPFVNDDPCSLGQLCPDSAVAKAFEPTHLGRTVVLAESLIGRLLTPICLDYIEGALWSEFGADFYLVPAMTPTLGRFQDRAKALGGRHGAASFVCNAQTEGLHRYHEYLPYSSQSSPRAAQVGDLPLFITNVPISV